MDEDNGKTNYLKEYSKYSSLIFQMIVIVATGVLGGIQLDKLFNKNGSAFTISLTIFTAFLAVYHLFKTLLKK
jgi:hypothetical protein